MKKVIAIVLTIMVLATVCSAFTACGGETDSHLVFKVEMECEYPLFRIINSETRQFCYRIGKAIFAIIIKR